MGVFEYEKFAAGTFGVAETLANLKVRSCSACLCLVMCEFLLGLLAS